jgi:hypothetical protein
LRWLIGLASLLFLALSGCARAEAVDTQPPVTADIPSGPFLYWQQAYPEYLLERAAAGDLNGDGKFDAVIIYATERGAHQMVVVIDGTNGCTVTGAVAAPVSDQVVTIFEMDGKKPQEIMVSGRNGDLVGSAVFRLEKEKLETLFSSGYGGCC